MRGYDGGRVSERRVTFPHMGEYAVAFSTFAEMMDCEAVPPPPMTRRTLEIGALHSPEFVCVPFKYNLGNFIEALDAGANVVVQAGGGCRFGYYAEVQEAILRDLGYEMEFVSMSSNWTLADWAQDFKHINPKCGYPKIARAFWVALRQAEAIEAVEDFVRKNVGFECKKGAMDRVVSRFLKALGGARSVRAVDRVRDDCLEELAAVPLDKGEDIIRVGVVGELYVVMDPYCNKSMERALADHGIEVHRFVTLSGIIKHGLRGKKHVDELLAEGGGWLNYHLGADGTESVTVSWKLMNQGFDGMVHLKPFGCMPEVSAMSVLQRIAREHAFPMLFVSYDAQTAETGIKTRVEAFCDMLSMRKRGSRGA